MLKKLEKVKELKSLKIGIIFVMILGMLSNSVIGASAKGSGSWETHQHDTGYNTTGTENKPYGIVAHSLINTKDRSKKYTTFCVEHGVNINNNDVYNGVAKLPDTAKMRNASKIAFLGWNKSEGDLFITDSNFNAARKKKYAFTNQYIWETLGQSTQKFVDANVQTEYENWKKQINVDKENLQKKPSFNGKKESINAGETKTLTDALGVLKDYESFNFTDKGVTFKHTKGQNTMTVSVAKNCATNNYLLTEGKAIDNDAVKGNTGDEDEVVHFSFTQYGANDGQDQLYANSYIDPIAMSLQLDIQLFGDVEIAKKDDKGKFVPNTEFKLSYNADMSNSIGTYKTGENGKVKVESLKNQTVYVQEVSVPNHLTLDTTVRAITVKANETVSYTATNNWKTGRVDLVKEDKETGSIPQGDAQLRPTEYTIRAKGSILNPHGGEPLYKDQEIISIKKVNGFDIGDVGVKEVNKDLKITWQNLPLGEYEVFESKAPEGYLLDETIYNVSITSNNPKDTVITKSVKSQEQVKKGKLDIAKVGIGEGTAGVIGGLKDVEFTMKLFSEVQAKGWDDASVADVLVTNEMGRASSKMLPYGIYQVRETKTPDNHYSGKDFFVFIGEVDGETIYRNVNNVPFSAWLELIKVDEQGNKITLNGATFKIKDAETGEYVKQKVGHKYIDTWTTDENGKVFLDKQVKYGQYIIEEITVPKGFVGGENVEVEINADNPNITFDDDMEPIITVTIENTVPKGKLILSKAFENQETLETLENGAQFKFTAVKDVISATDGKLIYKAGDVVTIDHEDGIYSIDENGQIVIENLPLGVEGATYQLEEVKTIHGYELLKKPIIFEFKITDTETKVYELSEKALNHLSRTDLLLNKVDSASNKNIKSIDFKFGLYEDKECTKLIKEVNANKRDGTALFEGLVYGTYYVKELEAPKGYELSDEIKEIVIDETLEGVDNVHSFIYENTLLPSTVIKTDDTSNVILYTSLCLLCGTVVMCYIRKKKGNEN